MSFFQRSHSLTLYTNKKGGILHLGLQALEFSFIYYNLVAGLLIYKLISSNSFIFCLYLLDLSQLY